MPRRPPCSCTASRRLHLAWPFVVEALPGVRLVAPDLRGRGASNAIEGPAGLRAHAADLAATLDFLGIQQTLVVGHSMGAFVSVVFAHLHPERVSRLVLVDGGLPLDVPPGLDPDTLVSLILGPTAARLSRRFADLGEYRQFWREHPAFQRDWSPELEQYLEYDLVDDAAGALRPATSYAVTVDDTIDMNTGLDAARGAGGPAAPDAIRHGPAGAAGRAARTVRRGVPRSPAAGLPCRCARAARGVQPLHDRDVRGRGTSGGRAHRRRPRSRLGVTVRSDRCAPHLH